MDDPFHLPSHHLYISTDGSRHPTFFQPYFPITPFSPSSYSHSHPDTYSPFAYNSSDQLLPAPHHHTQGRDQASEPISPDEQYHTSLVHRTITPDRLRRMPSAGRSFHGSEDDEELQESRARYQYTGMQEQEERRDSQVQAGFDPATTTITTTPFSPFSLSVRSDMTYQSGIDPNLPWRAAGYFTPSPSEGIQQALASPLHLGIPSTPQSVLPCRNEHSAASVLTTSTTKMVDDSASLGSKTARVQRRTKRKGVVKAEGDETEDPKKKLQGREGHFLFQLQGMLNDEGAPRLIYRDNNDDSIVITDAEQFEQNSEVLPKHMNSKHLDSFFRQLHLHGFSRRTEVKRNKKLIRITHPQLRSGLPLTSFSKIGRAAVFPMTRDLRHAEQRSLTQAKIANEKLEIDLEVAKARIDRLREALGTVIGLYPGGGSFLTGLEKGDLPGSKARPILSNSPVRSGNRLFEFHRGNRVEDEQDTQEVKEEVDGGSEVGVNAQGAEHSTAGQAGQARTKKRARKGCCGGDRIGHQKK